MKRQSTSKLLRLMVAVFALFLLVMAGSVLSACGGETVEENPNNNTPAEVHKHTYGAAEHTAIAKCGSTGYDVYTCTVCGDKYAIVTAATGEHDFKNGVCTVCGISTAGYDDTSLKEYLKTELDKINESVGKITTPEAAHKHDFKTTVKTIEPTCLSIGLTVKKCDCGSTTVEDLKDPLKHEYEEKAKVAATCTTDGQIEMVCKNCNDTYWAVNKDDLAKGHDFQRSAEDAKLDKPANCITPQLRAYKCTKCDEIDYQQFGDLNSKRHTDDNTDNKWVTEWNIWTEADKATYPLPEGTTVNSTTEISYGECTACHQTVWKTSEKDCTHEWEPFSNVIDRSCETDGWFNAQCRLCGKYANQAPTSWDKETNTLTFANTNFSYDIGEGDDETKEEAHVHLYKYAKTGHNHGNNELKENWEVDRDETTGEVITGSNRVDENGKNKTSNTTHWWSTTCTNCNLPIVVTKEGDSVKDMTTLYLDGNKKPEQDKYSQADWQKFFSREWHSWQLYDGTNETIEFENGKSIHAPTDARGPVNATCLDEGVEWYYCIDDKCREEDNNNGRWIKIELPALGHQWEKIDIDEDPTCTKGGTVTYICTRTITVKENGVDKEVSRCGHNGWDGTKTGTVKYDTDWATITFKYKADEFQKVIDGIKKEGSETEYEVKPFDWENEWRTKDEVEEGADPTYTWEPKYYEVWGAKGLWTATCGTTKDIKGDNPTVTPNGAEDVDNGLCGKDVLDYFTNADGSMKHEFLEKFMPQAHLWDEDTEAMTERDRTNPPTCYDGHVTIYKCVCKMNEGDCCTDAATGTAGAEAAGKCPKWEKKGKLEHLTKKQGEEVLPNTDTFTIYGFCGTNHTSRNDALCHKNYKVTYCIYCYAIISVEETGEENFHHFPFDREALYGLMINNAPLKKGTTLKALMEDPTLLAECTKNAEGKLSVTNSYEKWNKDATMRQARREFVEAWKGIGKYWFEEEGRIAENNIADFIRIKSNKLECYDCFAELRSIDTTEEIMELATAYKYEELNWALYYYVEGENGEMIRVTEDNVKTLNACEYQYYSQYKIWKEDKDGNTIFSWYSSMRDMTNTEWGNKTGEGKEAEEAALLQQIVGSIGKYNKDFMTSTGEVKPAGKHYLVPVKDYAKRPNFKRDETTNVVTMDWVCVFCGNTFELQVKYEAPKAEEPATAGETYKSDVVLVTPNEKMILLVDMKGVKFDEKTLNERGSNNNASAVFQKAGPFYAKDEIGKKNTTDKNGLWSYVAAGTVIIVEAHGSTDICVAHRLASDSSKYFEGDSSNGNNRSEAACIGSKLSADDFADASAKRTDENTPTLFETIWAGTYGTDGLDDESDSEGKQRLAVATRLDNLLREGGEIVVGGDLQELRKRGDKTTDQTHTWDAITPDAGTPAAIDSEDTTTKIHPLGSMNQQKNTTYVYEVTEDGSNKYYVPVLNLVDGTVLDLNGHTLYANIFIGAVDDSGNDKVYNDDGFGHTIKAGSVTIKNGTIVMSPRGEIQVEGKDAHLTLDNVEISGGTDGICAYNGATITVKNSNLITKNYALNSNNCLQTAKNNGAAGEGSANFYLDNSAFISTESTAFFMPAKGNIEATGCEFYGYNMGVYLRGHDLEEKVDAQDATKSTHAIFENCLFAKGDQASGSTTTTSGTNTMHFGALTIGNDNKDDENGNYGSIKNLVLKGCDFHIVKVEKQSKESKQPAATDVWTPAFESGEGKDHCDLNLGKDNDEYDSTCKTEGGTCAESTCTHRAIVLNIFGCSKLDKPCMSGDSECTEECGKQTYGKLELHLDETTLKNLIAHAQKFSHKTTGTVTNPFLGCTFTDGATLLGKCCKLKIFLIADGEDPAEIELNWTKPDGEELQIKKV